MLVVQAQRGVLRTALKEVKILRVEHLFCETICPSRLPHVDALEGETIFRTNTLPKGPTGHRGRGGQDYRETPLAWPEVTSSVDRCLRS
jgi:hypothetical protein